MAKIGSKFTIDLTKITIAEWRTMWDYNKPDAERDGIISKVSGLTPAEVLALTFRDYQALCAAIREEAGKPLADPNSASASISD